MGQSWRWSDDVVVPAVESVMLEGRCGGSEETPAAKLKEEGRHEVGLGLRGISGRKEEKWPLDCDCAAVLS